MSENPYHGTPPELPEPSLGSVVVEIENSYPGGHECKGRFLVDLPAEGESMEDWWQDPVFDLTGCGHGAPEFDAAGNCTRRTLDCGSEATIVETHSANAHLVGQSEEWYG